MWDMLIRVDCPLDAYSFWLDLIKEAIKERVDAVVSIICDDFTHLNIAGL